ncbi:MAG: hypothetical protein E3K36_16900 [Candidatus Brocadia sp.]|nr:hypothetical protein [Candidatus Brocadia sp.]
MRPTHQSIMNVRADARISQGKNKRHVDYIRWNPVKIDLVRKTHPTPTTSFIDYEAPYKTKDQRLKI